MASVRLYYVSPIMCPLYMSTLFESIIIIQADCPIESTKHLGNEVSRTNYLKTR